MVIAQTSPLRVLVGCSLRAGRVLSDLVAFVTLSHVRPPFFNAVLIQHALEECSDK
jgi:hypothetical protein